MGGADFGPTARGVQVGFRRRGFSRLLLDVGKADSATKKTPTAGNREAYPKDFLVGRRTA